MYVIDVIKNDELERKVFLHMIKTAGISVHQACNEAGHNLQFNNRHNHIHFLPQ